MTPARAHAGGRSRRRTSVAIALRHRQQAAGRDDWRWVTDPGGIDTDGDFASHAPADLDRAPRLERITATLPDCRGAGPRLQIHAVELLDHVFEFVRDQFRCLRRWPDMDVGRGEGAAPVRQGSPGVEVHHPRCQVLDQQPHVHVPVGSKPAALAPEGRRSLPHPVDERLQGRVDVEIRRQPGNRLRSARRRPCQQFSAEQECRQAGNPVPHVRPSPQANPRVGERGANHGRQLSQQAGGRRMAAPVQAGTWTRPPERRGAKGSRPSTGFGPPSSVEGGPRGVPGPARGLCAVAPRRGDHIPRTRTFAG